MADNAVIGALRVVLGADSAQLEDGFKRAQKSTDDFGRGFGLAAAAVAAGVAAMAISLGVAIKHAIDEADKIGKASQKIGIPVEQLSALKYAADLSDVSLQTLEKSVAKLSKGMVEAAAKPMSDTARAFNALGISVTDSGGKLKSANAIMEEVAGKFENMKDGAGKTAVSIALFGRAGAEMIPMLNTGKAAFAGLADEAAQLGIVIDTKTAKAAEAFNDNLKRLDAVKKGLIQRVTAEMLPAFLQMSQVLIESAKGTDFAKTVADGLTNAIRYSVEVALTAATVFQRLGAELRSLWTVLMAPNWETMKAAWAAFREEGNKTELAFKSLKDFHAKFWADSAATATAAVPAVTKPLQDFNFAAMAGKNALDQFLLSQMKSIAGMSAEAASLNALIGTKEGAKVAEQAYAVAKASGIALDERRKAAIDRVRAAMVLATQEMRGAHLVQENKEPHEKFRAELANNEAALRAVGATSEVVARDMQRVAERYGMTWGQMAESAAGSMHQVANVFGKENKAMGIAAKAFAVAQATISAYLAFNKALATLPPPASYVAAGAALATGLATVARIVSTPAFKTGGSFTVPGGVGGGDRKMMTMALEPGEQVDIWRPGQAGGDPRRGASDGGDRTVTIRFEGDDFGFGQKAARKILEALNQALANGARLQTA